MFFKNSINTYYFHMVHQSTSSSEYLFLSFSSGFLTHQPRHSSTSTYHLHYYSSTLPLLINCISLSFKPSIFWHLLFWFRVSSYFLLTFGCCGCWLPCAGLSLHYDRHWQCLLHKIHKQIDLRKGNTWIG